MSSVNKDNLEFSFPMFFFSFLIAWTIPSIMRLIRNEWTVSLDLSQSFIIVYDVRCRLFIDSLFRLRKFFPIPTWLRVFILLRIVLSQFMRNIGLCFSFLTMSLYGFCYQNNVGPVGLRSVLSSVFWKRMHRVKNIYS